MVMEPAVNFSKQLRCGTQVNLGGGNFHVAQVGGERGEPGVDVLPITIPGQQPMNCEGMPQIVDTRDGALVARNPAVAQQLMESSVDCGVAQTLLSLIEKQWAGR